MLDILIREAEALARPCFDLLPAENGDPIVAHWGGERSDVPNSLPEFVGAYTARRHLISVDLSIWDALDLRGREDDDAVEGCAFFIDTRLDDVEVVDTLTTETDRIAGVTFEGGIPLRAIPTTSLPPLQAVLLYGGPAIDDLLAPLGLARWQYDEFFTPARKAYESFFYESCPLTIERNPVARLGGWHLRWHDDEYYIPREMRLKVWTFQDAEPWYEVFLSPTRSHVVKTRIT